MKQLDSLKKNYVVVRRDFRNTKETDSKLEARREAFRTAYKDLKTAMLSNGFSREDFFAIRNELNKVAAKTISTKANPVPRIRLMSADGFGGGSFYTKVTDSDLENWYQDPRA